MCKRGECGVFTMNKLYVHIGTSKTATTSIQNFLYENQKVLNQKGYYYPMFPYRYADVSDKRNGHFMIADEVTDRQSGVFREGMDQIIKLFGKYPNIILSDEAIWSAPYKRRMSMWKALKAEAKEHGFRVRIIVYLRRQDAYLVSSWNQAVKSGIGHGGSAVKTWDEYVAGRTYARKMEYFRQLKKLNKFWGQKSLTVRRFEPKRFKNGSIYADFLDAVRLELTDEFKIEKFMRNERLEGNTLEIKRILNNMPGVVENCHSFFHHALLSYAELAGREYPCDMFSKEEAQAFMENYKKSNRRVAKKFFGEDELFDLSWKELPKWDKDNPYMTDDLIRFIGACCIQLKYENREFLKQIHDIKAMMRHPLRAAKQILITK